MAGHPKRRARRGEVVHPWAADPSLSSRPPFEAGNEMATRHGAWSERRVDPVAAQLVEGLLERRPDLAKYPEALLGWSRAESRCLLLESWFAERGLLDEKGQPTASERLLASSERLAMSLRERLGLDPRSEAELANAQADAARSVVDLDALRARGREALKARREFDAGGQVRGDGGHLRDGEEMK
jgi:hypothetical protein